jgi:hypothetical protein
MESELDRMCERYGIAVEWLTGPTHKRDDDGWEHHGGRVRLSYTDAHDVNHNMSTVWRMGMGIDPTTVSPADVIHSLAMDAHYGRESFEDFCGELGYDTDSRKAYRMWEACKALGPAFDDFCSSQQMIDDLSEAQH